MQELTVIEVQDDALIAADESGERYRVAVDDSVRTRLRKPKADAADASRISPREIQAQIRAGLSAAEISEITGASVDYVERFEGPIVAEREHIVATALSVPVRGNSESDDGATFGSVLRERLGSLSASGERWAAWREPDSGWVVKLSFTSNEIDHDARWSFDTRTLTLDPVNAEAMTLSQHGELREGLIPRLRAVTTTPETDTTRFDSGAFVIDDELSLTDSEPSPRAHGGGSNSIAISAIKKAEEHEADQNHTADLLDALRRRRGERETTDLAADPPAEHRGHERVRLVELPLEDFTVDDNPHDEGPDSRPLEAAGRARRGRAPIPSWDEIVFGARGDDDQA